MSSSTLGASLVKRNYSVLVPVAVPATYARARRAYVNLYYAKNGRTLSAAEKKKSAKQMRIFLKSFTYTGVADGEADRIEFTLVNSDWRWMRAWMPRKKDKITATIRMSAWKKGERKKAFPCGTFLIDSLGMEGPELTCTVGATSIPEASSFRATERDKSWKKVTLREVAKKIAARYKMDLFFDGDNFSVGTVEQNEQTDCEFLSSLCQEYAYGIKMFKGKLIIYSKAKYEAKKAVGSIKRSMLLDFSWETNIAGTYTGAKMKYTAQESDEETVVKVGKGNRWLTVTGNADSIGQARRKTLAALNTENEKTTTLSVTLRGNTKFCETDTVRICNLCRLDGKYFVDQVVHSLDGTNGFTTRLTMHKVQRRVTE